MRTNDVSARAIIGLSLGLALALNAPLAAAKGKAAASAAKSKTKVLVGGFEGPKSGEARKAVIAALKDDGGYDVSETSEAKPGADNKSYASASKGASAVLVGTVKKGGLVLSVRNGADGALVQDVEVKGDSPAKLNKNITDTIGLSIADAIAQTKPASAEPTADKPEAKPEGDEEKPTATEEAKPEASSDSGSVYSDAHSPWEIEAGLRAIHRSFTWHDTPADLYPGKGYPALRTYKLPLGPALFIDGTLYPLAFSSRGPGGNFGITGGYELNFATKSVYNEGTASQGNLTTKANQYFIGLKGRIPVGEHQFGLVAAYGQHVFNLLGDENASTTPDVWYKFFKLSAEGRLRFDAFSVGFHVGTRFVSNTGGLQRDWFKHVKTQVLEAGLQAGYTVIPNLDVIFGLDLTRYAFNFNPVPPGDPNMQPIAGGAVDQYVAGSLGVRYAFSSAHE